MNTGCLECGGTGILLDGKPCPICGKERALKIATSSYHATVPMQYQGVMFNKSFLPSKMQNTYGAYMEDLLNTIMGDYGMYQKNLLICSRPNSGKTVWAYSLITLLSDKGYDIPTVQNLMTMRELLNYRTGDSDLQERVQSSRGLIVTIPADIQFWMFDIIQTIVERRVARNGFTIFLFSGSSSKLREADRDKKLNFLLGTGSFHTIKMEDFTDVSENN